MKKCVKATIVLSTLLLLGCSLTDDDSADTDNNGNSGSISGDPVERVEIVNESRVITKEQNLDSFNFTGKAGKSYVITITDTSDNYYLKIASIVAPNGDDVPEMNNYTSSARALVAHQSGEYTVHIMVSNFENNIGAHDQFPFTIRIEEAATPSGLNGKWLLVRESGHAFGKGYTRVYDAASSSDLIEFRDDTLIRYSYEVQGDSVRVYPQIFADNWRSHLNFLVSDSTLTLSDGNKDGSYSEHYIRYSKNVSDLIWEIQSFTVPTELIGMWYNSSIEYRWHDFRDGELDTETVDEEYSPTETNNIYVITADSVYSYSRRGFSYRLNSYETKDSWLHEVAEVGEHSFSNISAGYEDEGDVDYDVGYDISRYSRYSGDLPPSQWTDISIPNSTISLVDDETHSDRTFKRSDTTWFKLPVDEGESYRIKSTVRGGDISMYLIDSEPKQITYFNGNHFFTANSTGEYYIFSVVDRVYSDVTEHFFNLTYRHEPSASDYVPSR